MDFTITGIVWIFGTFAFGLLVFRFYQYWKKEKTTASKFFVYFGISTTLYFLITAFGSFFFAQNSQMLKGIVIATAFFQVLASAFVACLISYLEFPKTSPRNIFLAVFILGLGVVVLTAILPFSPRLEEGSINWDINPLAGILRYVIAYAVTFIPISLILMKRGLVSETKELKTKAFGIGWLYLLGATIAPLDFFLNKLLALGALGSDIAIGFFGLSTLILVIFTQKPPSKEPKEKEYIPPTAPRISW